MVPVAVLAATVAVFALVTVVAFVVQKRGVYVRLDPIGEAEEPNVVSGHSIDQAVAVVASLWH